MNRPRESWKACIPRASCLRLFWHFMRFAASRTFCTAGRSRPMRTAIMAITTSSSMSVNARRNLVTAFLRVGEDIGQEAARELRTVNLKTGVGSNTVLLLLGEGTGTEQNRDNE